MTLWQVADLERYVDRDALLRADDPADPPYWAHLWSGARVLAAAVPHRAGRVLELGCGLGLPSLVAARRGARSVLAVDREQAALAFLRASARLNGRLDVRVAAADFTTPVVRRPFDLILLAEVLYDRAAFARVVEAVDTSLATDGAALLADGRRIDTTAFYTLLASRGFAWRAAEFVAREEGTTVRIRLARITRASR